MSASLATRASRRLGALAVAALAGFGAACASAPLDLSQADRVPMNRVYPYPTQEERAHGTSVVTIRAGTSATVEEADPSHPMADIGRRLDRLLQRSGARVVDSDADYTLRADLADYAYTVEFDRPTNWRLQSDEAMKEKPGTCKHRVEARLEVSITHPTESEVLRSFTLERSAETETKHLDASCPFDAAQREALLAQAMRSTVPCVKVPIANFFAPRGHLVERRRPADGGYDVFRSTLRHDQIPRDASRLEVYRVQHSTGADGELERREVPIATGRLLETAGVSNADTWLEIDVEGAAYEPLDGDVVRPVVDRGGMSSLNPWDACDDAVVAGG